MKLKIPSWNVRGFNENDKIMRIKGLIRDWKADIVCFQETKFKFITRELVRSLWWASTCRFEFPRFKSLEEFC
jgi:exonuclease III